jgi:GTP-binding protein Era
MHHHEPLYTGYRRRITEYYQNMPDPAPDLSASAGGLRAGLIAVVGRANVGKSSLVNRLLGEKISIVSPVAQTTRNMIRGVLTEPRGQLVFMDTPGVHKTSQDLGRLMNRRARAAVEGSDVALLVLDSSQPPREEDDGWMRRLAGEDIAVFAALNKHDLGGRYAADFPRRWDSRAAGPAPARPVRWFPVSALTGEGVEALLQALFDQVPIGPALFPDDVLTDFPRKLAIADMIREKMIPHLRDELPHCVAPMVEEIVEQPDGWHIRALLYVNKASQKGIVIGEKGRMLRKIKRSAEKELSALYEVPVSLDLWVKVEKDWSKNFWMLKKLGYA